MKTVQVFDPTLCCSTGVCGIEVDQALINFATNVNWTKKNGAQTLVLIYPAIAADFE